MDMEDPIQQLLKTTGWSCDDLLEKLQEYKSQKEPNKEEAIKLVNEDLADEPKECINDSTDEINNCDNPTVQNLKPIETDDKVAEVHDEKTGNDLSNSHIVNEEFSDTDEEETEVNTTNTNIINEIIDEISTGEAEGSKDRNDNLDYQIEVERADETTEVTEVRVIQVNTDDEDDDLFTDDGCQNMQNDEILNSNKFEYLETYPRKISGVINQPLINGINCNEVTNVDEEENVDFNQKANKNQPLINEEEADKSDETDCRRHDKLVATNDEKSDSICSETNLMTEEETDAVDLTTESRHKYNVEDAEKESSTRDLKVSKLRSSLSKICKKIELIREVKTDLPDLVVEENVESHEEATEEESVSENVEGVQSSVTSQLNYTNMHSETISATEQKVDNSNPSIKIDDKSHVEEKLTSENLEDVQDNTNLLLNCSDTHKETKLTTDKINSPQVDIEVNDEAYDVEESSTSENLEDIRNNLKLQLNSLRTRKKGHFLQDLRNNVTNVLGYNKKITSNPKDDSHITSVEDVDKSNEVTSKSDNLDDKLYTQTNEFGLVILNVQGGIDIDEIEDKSCQNHSPENNLNEPSTNTNNSGLETSTDFNDSNSFCQSNTEADDIEPSNGVFDEIRKIIRKQKTNTFKKNKKTAVASAKKSIDSFGFFSGSSELEASEEKTKNREKSADMSAENSSSSFTADDTNQTVEKNSPFVSNTLDEFLTGDSKLNISYNVPKCGAEEGLSESYHDDSPLLLKKVVNVNKEQSPKLKKIKIIKAKTLAQKRKMLEKQSLKQMKNLKLTLEPSSTAVKSEKTETAQEKGHSFVMVNDKKIWVKSALPACCIAKINTDRAAVVTEVKEQVKMNKRQRKLSLLTDLGKKIKEQVKYRPGPMCKKAHLQVSGQDNWETEMKTLPKILLEVTPKIGKPIPPNILSRLPQCDGKLTESHIEFALSVLKTKSETDVQQRTFKFPLPYKKNQENIFVRKQKTSPINCASIKPCKEEKSVDSVVANVIDDLITYVEIKEMAPSLIKEEEEKIWDTVADDKFTKMPVIANNISSIIKKPQKKKSKIELELSRLSCKVVNVEVEENLTQEVCNKPYCLLGCVCNSLKCDRILTYHCGKVQCMLNCTCPKERALVYDKVTLPAGTDILSTDAVSRIEVEAKKDLAKVEREFTQTVIHTNDKTIVVGLGGRYKAKRTTKIPKKFSDYVDSFEGVKEEEKEKDIDKSDFLRKCVVDLENLNLSSIIPFCLTHNLYNCYCGGKSAYTLANTSQTVEPILIEDDEEILKKKPTHVPIKYNKSKVKHANETDAKYIHNTKKSPQIAPANAHEELHNKVNNEDMMEKKQTVSLKKCFNTKIHLKPANPKKLGKNKPAVVKPVEDAEASSGIESQDIVENKTNTLKRPSKNKVPQMKKSNNLKENHEELGSIDSPTEKISSSGRPIRKIKKVKLREDFSYSCYLPEDCARVRGMSNHILQNYKDINKNKMDVQKNDFINNIREADLLTSKINNHDTRQMLEVDLLKKHLINESKRQKAMSLLINDQNKHKRKQTLEVRNDENSAKISFNQAIQRRKKAIIAPKNTKVQPVFDGEIIIDSRNMELLEKMGPRTVSDGYARLLPWKVLTESYRNGTIKIWSMVDTPSRLLVNKSDRLPPKNYINITQITPTTEVISWILRNKLPTSYHEDNVSFILKQTKDHYEICGLCTKNLNEDTNEATNKICSKTESMVEETDKDLTPFPHKDLNGKSQLLYIKRKKFKLQELIEENLAGVGEASIEKNRLYMWAALPEILRVCKWRIIFLNSDFTYLYFTKLKYSIKYTDLVGTGNMAKAGNFTVMLRNPLIQDAYDHPNFGIYFDSHYQDRIFIGPYSKEFDGSDIETLRYINKSLVCNESFYKMIGRTDYKCGHWLIERPYGEIETQSEQTIDLTHDSYQIMGKRKRDSDTDESVKRTRIEGQKKKERIVIMHNKEQIRVIDGPPRNPEEFNRYIITNIPHFGYLGAYKHRSNEIDVSWPFENKLLRFPTVSSAIDFLQERFSSLLQPIPETFKINVIVLTQIDLANSQPVDAKILSGHYICGDFGFHNVKDISSELCVSVVGMKREELLRIFAKRAQAFVRSKIEELADILHIEKSELGRYDIVHILEMAQKEIDTQKQIEKNNSAKKNELALQKRELALKAYCMISVLPEREQRWEQLKFRKILGKNSPNKDKTEPIVIPDSDEEENTDNNSSMDTISQGQSLETSAKSHLELDSTGPRSILLPVPDTDKVRCHDAPMVSILNSKYVPTKVTDTAPTFPPWPKIKLKSVLKPKPATSTTTALPRAKPSSSVSKESNSPENDAGQVVIKSKSAKPQYLTGVKIVKTSTGKFVLVSEKNDSRPFRLPDVITGTKIIIKNSKILSVRKIEGGANGCEQAISAPDSVLKNVNATSTQVCSPTNKNDSANESILSTNNSTDGSITQQCLEINTTAESSEILNESENSVNNVSAEVSDSSLNVPNDKVSEDNDSHTEVGDENK